MKFVILLALCALAVAAPKSSNENHQIEVVNDMAGASTAVSGRNSILINALIRQLINYIRLVINNGSAIFGLPPLDPLELDHFHLNIPAGLINLELELEDVLATGFGGFVVHTSTLTTNPLSFNIEISVPRIDISSKYDLIGDLLTAIPLYGKGDAKFIVEDFRLRALLFLKQSEDGRSILIDRIEGASFEIPHFKSHLNGAIGGGDIDAIVNAIIEEVLIDYINRFQTVIAVGVSQAVIHLGNPILDQLDTWRYIAPFV